MGTPLSFCPFWRSFRMDCASWAPSNPQCHGASPSLPLACAPRFHSNPFSGLKSMSGALGRLAHSSTQDRDSNVEAVCLKSREKGLNNVHAFKHSTRLTGRQKRLCPVDDSHSNDRMSAPLRIASTPLSFCPWHHVQTACYSHNPQLCPGLTVVLPICLCVYVAHA